MNFRFPFPPLRPPLPAVTPDGRRVATWQRIGTGMLLLAAVALASAPAEARPRKKTGTTKKANAPAAHAGKAASKRIDTRGENVNFLEWPGVAAFIDEMVSKRQFERAALEKIMRQVHYIDSAITLVKPAPPSRPKNWHSYRSLVVEPVRINEGLQFWNQ